MSRRLTPVVFPVALLALFLFGVSTWAAYAYSGQPQQDDASLLGRLATVEPDARRVSLVAEGESTTTELVVAEDSEVFQGNDKISLAELVTLVGNRVKVRYRMDNGVRVARTLTVEKEAQSRIAASDPIRQ